mgnify:CR=1 FL=1
MSAQVRLEREGPIGWLIFDHPERRNAIHRAMWEVIPERVALLNPKGMEIKFLVPRIGPPGTNSEPVTLQLRLEAMRIVALSEKQEAGSSPASLSSTKTWRVTSSPRR